MAGMGASSSKSTATTSAGPASMHSVVEIIDFSFRPATATVKVGGTVTWKQVDPVGHSVESTSTPPAWTTSAVLKKGQSFSHTFTKAGTYSYICGVHNYMMGKVVVTG
jgi:plastocyanin